MAAIMGHGVVSFKRFLVHFEYELFETINARVVFYCDCVCHSVCVHGMKYTTTDTENKGVGIDGGIGPPSHTTPPSIVPVSVCMVYMSGSSGSFEAVRHQSFTFTFCHASSRPPCAFFFFLSLYYGYGWIVVMRMDSEYYFFI